MGMVEARVKVPQGLWERALTTATPRPASATTTINRTARPVAVPLTVPISSRAICGSEHQDAASQETPVEPVGQHIKAGGRYDKPERIDLLIRPYNARH